MINSGGIETECNKGYTGRLCAICVDDINGTLWGKQDQVTCGECQGLTIQILKLVGVSILLAIYLAYLI